MINKKKNTQMILQEEILISRSQYENFSSTNPKKNSESIVFKKISIERLSEFFTSEQPN